MLRACNVLPMAIGVVMSLTGCHKTKEPNPLRESLLGTWEGGLNNPFQPSERFTIRLDVRDNDSILMSFYGRQPFVSHYVVEDSTLLIEERDKMRIVHLTDSTLKLFPWGSSKSDAMIYAVEFKRIR
ncbi:MAG TPA: hypothetical protein PLW14_05065 [Chlorobiota bacterium]|nr:hypothetical protein [Chlorobiota bacterium]